MTLNKISELLKEQKKKQKDLTDFLGLSKNAYTNWKNGNNNSYLKHIGKIAEFFGVSTDYLLCTNKNNSTDLNVDGVENEYTVFAKDGTPGAHTIIANTEKIKKLNELLKSARELPEDKIDMLLKMADSIK